MPATENYRINSTLDAYAALAERLLFAARERGDAATVRDIERTHEFVLALNTAETDDEIDRLVSLRAST